MKKFLTFIVLLAVASLSYGQAISVNGGSIEGTITDPTGATIPNAAIAISGTDTGYNTALKTNSAGAYSVGPLNPGQYTVTISAPGFQKLQVTTIVQTGTATSGNFKLTVGSQSDSIEVNAGAVQINTEQAGVTGVITSQQIDSLPVNGRNILDFAQLQPGVQLQAGGSDDGGFDPTKAGYSALSFNGISGRTTRILLDGQDITDETVGTTIFNVSQGSVGELQVSRATNDVSGEITSSGSVLASTRSGTNTFHGQLFYNFQDQRAGAATFEGVSDPFQRNQYGGSIGGPIIKDKLFFFGNAERLKQDQSAGISLDPKFGAIQSAFPNVGSPDRDTYSAARLDYNGPWATHFFVRGNYEANSFSSGSVYSIDANRDNTPGIAAGADYAHGRFTHSIRGSYEKFHNFIADSTAGNNSLYNPIQGVFLDESGGLETGPNDNAPQATFQSDKQLRYDGSWTKGAHSVRFGGSMNRIQGGGLAAFFGYGPLIEAISSTAFTGPTKTNANALGCKGVPGAAPCTSDPINGYHPYDIVVSNGQGFASENPGFGLPGGAQADWRTGFYLTDSWKIRPTFTLTIGARYDRDTGRTNSDLAPVPCSAIVTDNFSSVPCTGNANLFDQWGAGFGGRVAQPNRNVGPQMGFTYAPAVLNNKTVFRGGIGLFFESNVFNNVQFDRSARLATGKFAAYPDFCYGGNYSYPIPGKGLVTATSTGVSLQTICSESVAAGASAVLQLQADVRAGGAQNIPNTGFAGYGLQIANGAVAYTANYRSPYSLNINFGMQQEIHHGLVASVDYIHTGTFRIAQTIDANHVGDSRYLDAAAAAAAINATVAAIPACAGFTGAAGINCAINNGAGISDFASNGLDSGVSYNGGYPTSFSGSSGAAAFPGQNPKVGVGTFALPQGKAGYDGLQLNLRQQTSHPIPGIVQSNLEASYAYSRFVTTTGDNGISTSDPFFAPPSYDNRDPGGVIGYAGLDRTNIFSLGASMTVKYGVKVGLITHFESAVPTNLTMDTQGGAPGEIFRSDVDGDGRTGDLVPGTEPGAYMRNVKPAGLNKFISNYNSTQANTLTPAGQALVSAGLFTVPQLVALGAVKPALAQGPANPFANTMLRTLDMNFSYPITFNRIHEGFSIEPGVAIYNVGNFANFGGPQGAVLTQATIDQSGDGGLGNVNGVSGFATSNQARVSRRTGTFDQGAPRATEFQLKLNF